MVNNQALPLARSRTIETTLPDEGLDPYLSSSSENCRPRSWESRVGVEHAQEVVRPPSSLFVMFDLIRARPCPCGWWGEAGDRVGWVRISWDMLAGRALATLAASARTLASEARWARSSDGFSVADGGPVLPRRACVRSRPC